MLLIAVLSSCVLSTDPDGFAVGVPCYDSVIL